MLCNEYDIEISGGRRVDAKGASQRVGGRPQWPKPLDTLDFFSIIE